MHFFRLSRVGLTHLAMSAAFAVGAPGCRLVEDGDRAMGSGLLHADQPSGAEQAVHAVCGSGSTVKGIDVSKWQGTINWSSVANDGVKFAFIRVSDGTGYIDEKFQANWTGARANGIKRGAYQFFRSNQDPIEQANILLTRMGPLEAGDLPPVIDVESTDGVSNSVRAQKIRAWLEHVEASVGVKPFIYTGGYFWDDHVAQDFSEYPLWHAGYTGGTCPSTVSRSWTDWAVWQWTSSGRVAGISGNVDMNRFNGTMAELNAFGVAPCEPATEVCNGMDDNCDGVVDEGDVCVPRDEAIFGAALFDSRGSADFDGDGTADVCARAAAGLVCSLSGGGGPLTTAMSTTSFANANGWDDVTNYATLRMGDVTGDGKADICARANSGMVCKASTGDGLDALFRGPELSDASGWDKARYYSTIRLADVNGDGKADICARAAAGWRCYLSEGASFGAAIAGAFFRNEDGFDAPSHYGTIRMADIDGDGRVDVCARSSGGVECHRLLVDSSGTATWSEAIVGPPWSNAAGFQAVEYWSTLRFADLDGDRRDDVCIRAANGLHCRLSTGSGFSDAEIVGPPMSDENGWSDDDNYATLRFGDVNGDGRADLCARANLGARCWPFQANGTFGTRIDGPDFFGDAGGFDVAEQYRTFRLADVDGDARADLCGRGAEGFTCFLSNGTSFDSVVDGPRWGNNNGWLKLMYSGTVLMSGYLRCRPMPEVCDGIDNDCNGARDDADMCAPADDGGGSAGGSTQPDHTQTGTETGPDGSGDSASVSDLDTTDTDAPAFGPSAASGCASTPTSTFSGAALLLCIVRRRRRKN